MYASVILLQADGLTIGEVLADIPHDPAAVFVYVLLAASLALIWRVNRRGPRPPTPGDRVDPPDASPEGTAHSEKRRATEDENERGDT